MFTLIDDEEKFVTQKEFQILFDAHQREHDLHAKSHESEHIMSERALTKADTGLERRLEGMNEFRAQLEKQAGAFLTRETFEAYSKEQTNKSELALKNTAEKYDTIINAIVSRHDSDFESIRESIQSEREYRKSFEGSMNTWKWIASFLGASGVAGVILLFLTKFAA